MTITTLAVRDPPAAGPLDIASLRRVTDGGFAPWIILLIAGTPTLPAALVYLLLWQWLQVFTRVLVSVTDGEPLARSVYGP